MAIDITKAEQLFRQQRPLLLELARDGAWDAFHDVWTDLLHDCGDPWPDTADDDIRRARGNTHVTVEEAVDAEIRYELNYLRSIQHDKSFSEDAQADFAKREEEIRRQAREQADRVTDNVWAGVAGDERGWEQEQKSLGDLRPVFEEFCRQFGFSAYSTGGSPSTSWVEFSAPHGRMPEDQCPPQAVVLDWFEDHSIEAHWSTSVARNGFTLHLSVGFNMPLGKSLPQGQKSFDRLDSVLIRFLQQFGFRSVYTQGIPYGAESERRIQYAFQYRTPLPLEQAVTVEIAKDWFEDHGIKVVGGLTYGHNGLVEYMNLTFEDSEFKSLTGTKSMSTSDAEAYLRSRQQTLVEMAQDEMWGPFEDFWEESLDHIGWSSYGTRSNHKEDAQAFVRYLRGDSGQLLLDDIDYWIRQTVQELRSQQKGLFDFFHRIMGRPSDELQKRGEEAAQAGKVTQQRIARGGGASAVDNLRFARDEHGNEVFNTRLAHGSKGLSNDEIHNLAYAQIPLVIELVRDGAWGPLQDLYEDQLDALGLTGSQTAANVITMARREREQYFHGPEHVADFIAGWMTSWARRHGTKGLSYNDGEGLVERQRTLMVQLARDGAWGPLQDVVDDLMSDLGLTGVTPVNQTLAIRWLMENTDDTPAVAVDRVLRGFLEGLPQSSTKGLSGNDVRQILTEKIPTMVEMIRDGAWGPLQDFWEDACDEVGYGYAHRDGHRDATELVQSLRSAPNPQTRLEWWVGTTIDAASRNNVKSLTRAQAIAEVADMLDMDRPTSEMSILDRKSPDPSSGVESFVNALENCVAAGDKQAAIDALHQLASYYGMESTNFFNSADRALDEQMKSLSGVKIKAMSHGDARAYLQSKRHQFIDLIEDEAWYALHDWLEDVMSDLGLRAADPAWDATGLVNVIRVERETDRYQSNTLADIYINIFLSVVRMIEENDRGS